MIRCQSCATNNLDGSQYCDECGSPLQVGDPHRTDLPNLRPHTAETPIYRSGNVTSVGIPPLMIENGSEAPVSAMQRIPDVRPAHATLTIERGDAAGTEFPLSPDESNIGRWDADNGIFPDVDLDSHDQEAKVSRRHARILYKDGKYFIEDLGSTNGTYVNRGRRLIPGNPQTLVDGDEIIVGKTFLRFHVID
jgi:FOG: FHA domain